MSKPVFGYWNIRGLAEPCRFLLRYKEVDFEDKQYDVSNMEEWLSEKFTLGLDFPNLPYLIDGDVKLTQSTTILRYLAEKYDLDGKTEKERIRVSLIEQELIDVRLSGGMLCYSPEFETLKGDFIEKNTLKLQGVVEFLGDRKFLAGDKLTYVDFMAIEVIDFHRYLIPRLIEDNPKLKEYYDRIRNLPKLKKYLESSLFKAWPLRLPAAKFGGSGPQLPYAE